MTEKTCYSVHFYKINSDWLNLVLKHHTYLCSLWQKEATNYVANGKYSGSLLKIALSAVRPIKK